MTNSTARPGQESCEIETDRLRDMLQTFGARFSEIVGQYRAALPGRLAAMEDAAAMGAHDMLAAAAHRLAGSSASLGARRVTSLCRALETECITNDAVPADWEQKLSEIACACAALDMRLDALEHVQ